MTDSESLIQARLAAWCVVVFIVIALAYVVKTALGWIA